MGMHEKALNLALSHLSIYLGLEFLESGPRKPGSQTDETLPSFIPVLLVFVFGFIRNTYLEALFGLLQEQETTFVVGSPK